MKYPRLHRAAGCFVLVAAAALAGCHKTPVVVVAPTIPPVADAPLAGPPFDVTPPALRPVVVVVPPRLAVAVSPAVPVLEAANQAFSSGDYLQAIKNTEEYLRLAPMGDRRDEALFQLGLINAVPENPNRDWQRAAVYLKRVVSEFPQSPSRPAAELILSLHGEITQLTSDTDKRDQRIRQLSTELERLKQIDAARRRRP